MADRERPGVGLFNNPLLSDFKIKQVSKNGQVREYHAHKAVLSAGSHFFYKAFTGNFREASEAEMTVHDDDPKYFEFFLKFMYTHQYDKATIIKLAAGDKYARIRIPVAIHAVADKYDMLLLLEPIAKDVEELLAGEIQSCPDIVVALIKTYYETMPSVGSPLGKILVSKIQTNSDNYCGTDEFVDLMKAYPIFGADVALSMTNLLCPLLVPYTCGACKFAGGVNRAGLRAKGKWVYYCESCGSQRNLT